jgi:N-acyl-D-amino-acid deacylase
MYDLILKNGKISDGSGNPWFRGEVGILNGKIKNIGQISGDSTCTLDINNLVVCPGFIDIHSHSDISVLVNPKAESKIMQGVTTEVIGNCGLSPAPMRAEIQEHLRRQFLPSEFEWNWPNYSDFLETHEKNPSSLNIAPLFGHGALRAAVLGLENRAPTKEESLRMQKLLSECLDAGVLGLSTGLVYSPACFANTDEIIELARLLKKVNRLYTTHIRGEGANLIRAVEEALQIGREAEIPVQLSHHKAAGLDN